MIYYFTTCPNSRLHSPLRLTAYLLIHHIICWQPLHIKIYNKIQFIFLIIQETRGAHAHVLNQTVYSICHFSRCVYVWSCYHETRCRQHSSNKPYSALNIRLTLNLTYTILMCPTYCCSLIDLNLLPDLIIFTQCSNASAFDNSCSYLVKLLFD